jgi:hypothetical protein
MRYSLLLQTILFPLILMPAICANANDARIQGDMPLWRMLLKGDIDNKRLRVIVENKREIIQANRNEVNKKITKEKHAISSALGLYVGVAVTPLALASSVAVEGNPVNLAISMLACAAGSDYSTHDGQAFSSRRLKIAIRIVLKIINTEMLMNMIAATSPIF